MWHKENPLPQSPFFVVSKSLDGYLPEFAHSADVDFAPIPSGEISFSPMSEYDKWTNDCQSCIAVLAQGKYPDESTTLSVLFHIHPRSVDGLRFLNKSPYFNIDYPRILKQLRDNTIKGTRAVGIAGGYIGPGEGMPVGLNRLFYRKMVSEVKKMSMREDFPEPYILQPPKKAERSILQPPKQIVSFTDVYWMTQKGIVTLVTRRDESFIAPLGV